MYKPFFAKNEKKPNFISLYPFDAYPSSILDP